MKKIPDKSIHLVTTDLPFGTLNSKACPWDVPIDLDKMWIELKRIGVDNCAYVFNCSQPFTTDLINSNRKWFSYEIIWEKERPTNIFTMKKQPAKVHENIAVFGNKQLTYNPIMEPSMQPNTNKKTNKSQSGDMNTVVAAHTMPTARISDDYDPKMRYPRSVKKISRGTKGNKKLHPTQKPVELCEHLIRTYSNEGDLVLDICSGSASNAIACLNSNRHFIGIELDDNFFQVGKKRVEEHIKLLGYGRLV
jgi:site-specific DNA-methyltransferase (adenine-specific)